MKKKVLVKIIENEEEAANFKDRQKKDDILVKQYFERCSHKEFISGLMQIGTLLDIITTYFDFVKPDIQESLKTSDEVQKLRRIRKHIKDLNARINEEYKFDDDILIIEECVVYEGELYLFINKFKFLKIFKLIW